MKLEELPSTWSATEVSGIRDMKIEEPQAVAEALIVATTKDHKTFRGKAKEKVGGPLEMEDDYTPVLDELLEFARRGVQKVSGEDAIVFEGNQLWQSSAEHKAVVQALHDLDTNMAMGAEAHR